MLFYPLKNINEKIRILIADDHEIVRLGIRFMLSDNERFEILEEAIDGFEVIELAKHYKPDLILMDYLLPEFNGLEATLKIKEVIPNIKIILFTAYEDQLSIYDMLDSGIDALLSKDTSQENFLYSIEQVLQDKYVFTKNIIKTLINIGHSNYMLNEKPVVLTDELSEKLRFLYGNDKLLKKNKEKEKVAEKLKSYFYYVLSEINYDMKQQIV